MNLISFKYFSIINVYLSFKSFCSKCFDRISVCFIVRMVCLLYNMFELSNSEYYCYSSLLLYVLVYLVSIVMLGLYRV